MYWELSIYYHVFDPIIRPFKVHWVLIYMPDTVSCQLSLNAGPKLDEKIKELRMFEVCSFTTF